MTVEELQAAGVRVAALVLVLHDCVVAVRRAEATASAGLDEETLVARHRWRY